MPDLLDEVATYLDADVTVPYTLGTDLFLGQFVDDDDNDQDSSIVILEYPGSPLVENFQDTLPVCEKPRIQVQVRHTSYATGKANARAIWKSLLAVTNTTLSGTRYLRIVCTDSPAFLKRDAKDRAYFVVNAECWRVAT